MNSYRLNLFLFLVLTSILNSCSLDPVVDIPTPNQPKLMNFEELNVGDEYIFQRFIGSVPRIESVFMNYVEEYLKLQVLEEFPDNKFLVGEAYYAYIALENEPVKKTSRPVLTADSLRNYLQVRNDSVFLTPVEGNNHVISNFFDLKKLSLREFRSKETSINLWQTGEPFITQSDECFTVGFELNGFSYDTLNVAIENGPMASDGCGHTCIYSKENGIVRMVNYSYDWFTQGWDRIYSIDL